MTRIAAIALLGGLLLAMLPAMLPVHGPALAASQCRPAVAAAGSADGPRPGLLALAGDRVLAQLPGLRDPRGRGQLACNSGCLRGCQSAYRRCLSRTRNWARCSARRRACIRRCGC